MADIFADMTRLMDRLTAPMGTYAPRRRRLVVDYKDSGNRDYHQDLMTWHNPDTTDADLVESVRESLAQRGYMLTAILEILEGGRYSALYLGRSYLKEYLEELGLPMPKDMAAALTLTGIHPVNWEELVNGR